MESGIRSAGCLHATHDGEQHGRSYHENTRGRIGFGGRKHEGSSLCGGASKWNARTRSRSARLHVCDMCLKLFRIELIGKLKNERLDTP